MNDELFRQAQLSYVHRDYDGALAAFTDCLQDSSCPFAPGEVGLLYHQIGNCLVKLGNPLEAINAYSQATADTAYDACGAVNYNLGMAYASLYDYEDAVKHFEISVSDARYDSAYKAYAGMGNALLKLGKTAEAGVAFREAALDENNPDPTKSLLNLGVCFMALDRPADAVISYESALQLNMAPGLRNKLYANLGQAYVACGQMQKATAAFEEAIADKTYVLSDSASVDYQRAVAAVAQGNAEVTQALGRNVGADFSGLDVSVDVEGYDERGAYGVPQDQNPYYYSDPYGGQQGGYGQAIAPYGGGAPYGQGDAEYRFFNSTDEELEQWSRDVSKQKRKGRNTGLKVFFFLIVLILVLIGAGIYLYSQGYGYPMQESIVEQLFSDPDNAAELFSSNLSDDQVESMLMIVVEDAEASIDGVNRGMSSSVAYVTATTEEGGEVTYEVTLVRDFIGWKVSNVELYFTSQN